MEGHGRPREDARRRAPRLTRILARAAAIARRGPWRVAVADRSMAPAVEPGDWLLVDPTLRTWPRRGSVVVFREPGSEELAIKRVVARPGDWLRFAGGWLRMGPDEAWLLGDATDEELRAAGSGGAIDSRRYGPVTLERLAARAWFRYAPASRIGLLATAPSDLAVRSAASPSPFAPPEIAPTAESDEAGRSTQGVLPDPRVS